MDQTTEGKYWDMVLELDWPRSASQDKRIKTMLCFTQKHRSALSDFTKFVRNKARELRDVINSYEEKTGKSCNVGDDGFSDLCYHIVGLGKTQFKAVIARPQLALKRAQQGNFEESFAYMLHFDDLAENITPQRYVNWAAKEIKNLATYAETITSNQRQEILADLTCAMYKIASGDFDIKPWLIKDYYKVYAKAIGDDKDAQYTIPNLLLDLSEYAPYFSKESLATLRPAKVGQFTDFNRKAAIAALNQDILQQLKHNNEARSIFVQAGFVPFATRSNESLRKALLERHLQA